MEFELTGVVVSGLVPFDVFGDSCEGEEDSSVGFLEINIVSEVYPVPVRVEFLHSASNFLKIVDFVTVCGIS